MKETTSKTHQFLDDKLYYFCFIQSVLLGLLILLHLGHPESLEVLFPDVVVDAVEESVPALPGASQLVPVKVSHVGTHNFLLQVLTPLRGGELLINLRLIPHASQDLRPLAAVNLKQVLCQEHLGELELLPGNA